MTSASPGGKGNRAHFLAPRIKEDGVLRPAENGRDLVEQTGLHPDEPMLGALTKPRDLEWWQDAPHRA